MFLDLFTKAWATEPFTPKLHWLLHYSDELQAHGTLFSCFVHERKHKVIKRYGNPIANMRVADRSDGFEESVMNEVSCHHIAMLKNFDTKNCKGGLVNPTNVSEAHKAVLDGVFGPGMVTSTAYTARFTH